uniref:NACHT domain-containing protein n=1 Tax=Hucho hucho TaxID=62062 RepID=A0A4W5N735_9TELE
MACTRQSALEYIQNRRRLLVERLQNLPLIVENLFQRKVFHEEEVSKIQAEVDRFDQTRKILDWVTAKGEAACYELLVILDITRKRTLDNADLQQWISCFPFKEDPEMTDYLVGSKPCQRYQSQLKCKARKITECTWKQSCSLLPERCRNEVTFSYTPLVLDTDVPSSLSKIKTKSKRCKKARPKKLKSFIPIAKQETSPADLLKTPKRRILLFGKPGIGKTAVAHQMLNLWAQKDHRELDYMFYFDVRDISPGINPMSLEDLLFNMYSEPEESREEVLQDIKKNSENVVVIFDGITDLSFHSVIKKLVDKDLLPDAKIVITCRPEVPSGDFLTDWPSFRVEVKGFSNESILAYLTKMLSAEPNPKPNHDSLSSVLNNLELFSLCHVPMYALMVVACIYYSTPEASKQPWPTTKMYINILRYCLQKHGGKRLKDPDKCLVENREQILSLAEIAFDATQQKTMNLTELSCEASSVQFAFLGALMIMVEPTVSNTYSAFLHYTVQEFFGALWLLQNPDKIREVLQKCQTEEWKHTKHMVPFLCGLLNERNIRLVNGLVPAQKIKKTSDWFFKEVVNTFLPLQTNQDHAEGGAPEFEIDLLFLCQCLYESQSTEACLLLLDKLDYSLDLDKEHLDPHHCCAVSYMISQSAKRKVGLDLNSCTVSDQGLRLILGSLKNVQYLRSDPSMLCQLWTTLLSGEADIDFTNLLGLCGNELHLPFLGERRVFERAEEVMKQSLERVNLCLHWDRGTLLSEALSKTILKCLTHINKLSFTPLQNHRGSPEKLEKEQKAVLLNLCLQAALHHRETFQGAVDTLLSLFTVYQTERYDILIDLYSHVKQAGRSILPSLRPLYQPAPAIWFIDLSERKAFLLLEVLKLQPEKKSVELKGWSDKESEVRSFLQCLPYISKLR